MWWVREPEQTGEPSLTPRHALYPPPHYREPEQTGEPSLPGMPYTPPHYREPEQTGELALRRFYLRAERNA